jgi:predicted phage tail protein
MTSSQCYKAINARIEELKEDLRSGAPIAMNWILQEQKRLRWEEREQAVHEARMARVKKRFEWARQGWMQTMIGHIGIHGSKAFSVGMDTVPQGLKRHVGLCTFVLLGIIHVIC